MTEISAYSRHPPEPCQPTPATRAIPIRTGLLKRRRPALQPSPAAGQHTRDHQSRMLTDRF